MLSGAGIRVSALDIGVLAAGAIGAILAAQADRWLGVAVGLLVCQFFLFCNVFHVARVAEVLWALLFGLLVASTIATGVPGWGTTLAISIVAGIVAIAAEMRKPSYRGPSWRLLLSHLLNGHRWPIRVDLFALGGIAAVAIGDYFYPFLSGQRAFIHDSLIVQTTLFMFYDRILAGELPLWSAEINAGQPLWPHVETMPYFDPLVAIPWIGCRIAGCSAAYAYQLNVFLWLLAFAIGVWLCVRRISGSSWVALACFACALMGPVAYGSIAQSQGFIEPHRYAPLTVFLMLRLIEWPGALRAVHLALALIFSAAGYQTSYSAFFLALLGTLLVAGTFVTREDNRFRIVGFMLLAAALAIPAYLPLLVAGKELLSAFYSIPHSVFLSNYFFPANNYVLGLFWPEVVLTMWHGSTYIGFLIAVAAVFSLGAAIWLSARLPGRRHLVEALPESHDRVLLVAVSIAFVSAFALTCGSAVTLMLLHSGDGIGKSDTLLGARNWGFALTMSLFFLILLGSFGHRVLVQLSGTLGLGAGSAVALGVALVIAGLMYSAPWLGVYSDECRARLCDSSGLVPALAISLAAAAAVVFVAFVLLAGKMLPPAVAPGVIAIIFAALSLWQLLYTTRMAVIGASDYGVKLWPELALRAPKIAAKHATYHHQRDWEFDPIPHIPYHYEGPTVFHQPSAYIRAVLDPSLRGFGITPLTHQLRLGRYQEILDAAKLPGPALDRIFAVTEPVTRLVGQAITARDSREAISLARELASDAARFRCMVVLEGGSSPAGDRAAQSGEADPCSSAGAVWISSYGSSHAAFRVATTRPAWLVYADAYTADWGARIDGARSELLIANGYAKAVLIPSGVHQVEFVYSPTRYVLAFWLRNLWVLALLALAFAPALRRARASA